jgi:predicted metal-dependent HD superfamily phosphohydrolase
VIDLLDRWGAALTAAGSRTPVAEQRQAGADLLRRWSEAHRRYHTAAHLTQMLSTVDEMAEAADDPAAVRLATWFHDAVYDPRRPDNEEASAEMASSVLTALNVPAGTIAEVMRLIRLTASHNPAPDDRNGRLLCDADLAILAAAPSAYRRYADAVRAEYAHVDEDAFRAGRAAVLRRLLARPTLFSLPSTREEWEKRARINMAMEVSVLTAVP